MNLATVMVLCLLAVSRLVSAKVVLIGKNMTRSFDSVEANFAPLIKSSGECGTLYAAMPLDACSDLTNIVEKDTNSSSAFALIIRGGCSFEEKIRMVQKAGFKAAIVYDNEDGDILVSMAGNPSGVKIHGVFVSKKSGETLKKFVGSADIEVWLIPSFENSAWSIMAISFISLLAMSAVLASCFFVRRHRVWRRPPHTSRVREFRGMSNRLVQAMPSLTFTAVLEDNCTSSTCAICLEDYTVGDKIRILPCRHKFHAFCVDSWLTTWRTFCPVCKRDARTISNDPTPSESTPLLSSNSASSYSLLPSPSRSPYQSSSNIQTAQALQSPSVCVPHSQSHVGSFRRSSPIHVSRSSMDLRHAYSQSQTPHVGSSPHSLGYYHSSSFNTRYMSQYRPSPSNASSACLGFSSHQAVPLRNCESAGTFSPFASANSLPGC